MSMIELEDLSADRIVILGRLLHFFPKAAFEVQLGPKDGARFHLGVPPSNHGRALLRIVMGATGNRPMTLRALHLVSQFMGSDDVSVEFVEHLDDPLSHSASFGDRFIWLITTPLENWK